MGQILDRRSCGFVVDSMEASKGLDTDRGMPVHVVEASEVLVAYLAVGHVQPHAVEVVFDK